MIAMSFKRLFSFRPITAWCCIIWLAWLPSALAGEDRILVSGQGFAITKQDLDMALQEMGMLEYMDQGLREELLMEMVRIELFAQEARQHGLDQSPEVLRQLRFMENQFLANEFFQGQIMGPVVQDDTLEKTIREQYHNDPERFAMPERRRIQQILLLVDPDADEQTWRDKGMLADEILERIQGGEDFGALAAAHSDVPSFGEGPGDLGYVVQGALAPEHEEIVFTFEAGEVGPVIQTSDGYAIFVVDEILSPETESFEQVKDLLMEELRFQMTHERLLELETDLMRKYDVQFQPVELE